LAIGAIHFFSRIKQLARSAVTWCGCRVYLWSPALLCACTQDLRRIGADG